MKWDRNGRRTTKTVAKQFAEKVSAYAQGFLLRYSYGETRRRAKEKLKAETLT
jgi:hypothetical protein